MSNRFPSTWHKMRELVILSLNIIYIKDILQQSERLKARLIYLNFSEGPIEGVEDMLRVRKRQLNLRMKNLLEEILNSSRDWSLYGFNVDIETASLTRKQLEKGYAIFTNIREVSFALNLRNGALSIIYNPEDPDSTDANLRSLEYTARHEGPVYKFFNIDMNDPLTGLIRY